MWNAAWDVSGAAPCPVGEGQDRMDLWVDSIYQNLRGYMDMMRVSIYFAYRMYQTNNNKSLK